MSHLLYWAVFLGVLSVLIVVHEWGHFIVARWSKVRVERFSIGFGRKVFGWTRGGTEYWICMIPLGGYVKMTGEQEGRRSRAPDEYLSQSVGTRARIVAAGPLLNYLLAWSAFTLVFWLGQPIMSPTVGQVVAESPAQAVGIQVGDRILAIDAKPVADWQEITEAIHHHPAGLITLEMQRGEETVTVRVEPRLEELPDPLGRRRQVNVIGIVPSDVLEYVRHPLMASCWLGTKQLTHFTALTLQALTGIALGQIPASESLAGPVGIYEITKEATKLGAVHVLLVMGLISMSLGIFNLFPIPVLDGGHLLFLFLERLRGRPVNQRIQELAIQAGMAVLILLTVFVFYLDFTRHGWLGGRGTP